MTTLPIHAGTLPRFSPMTVLTRVAAVCSAVIDVYAEALQQARDAQKRYPFAFVE